MQRSASLTVAMVTNPNPRDSLVHGSSTMLASITSPSAEKCFSRSRSVTRADKPVTYRLFPGFSTSLESTLLERLLYLERLLRLGDVEYESDSYLDPLE